MLVWPSRGLRTDSGDFEFFSWKIFKERVQIMYHFALLLALHL